MGRINDLSTVVNYKDKDLNLDSDSAFTAAGTNTLSGATTISGTLTVTGKQVARAPVAKTASYTVTAADAGTTFTNRGDTDAITFTLPAAASNTGAEYYFFAVEDFALAVAAPADTIVGFNSNALTSVKLSTASEIMGGGFRAISDGTSWLVFPMCEETQTITVA